MVDFYCKKCGLDQKRHAHKVSNRLITCFDGDFNIVGHTHKDSYDEFYETSCKKCGTILVRYITNKNKDPYFYESKKLLRERSKLAKDLIQPWENDFGLHYKDQWRNLEKTREKEDEKQKIEKKKRDWMYKKYGHDPERKKVIDRVYGQ